jgi:hypothetical protein
MGDEGTSELSMDEEKSSYVSDISLEALPPTMETEGADESSVLKSSILKVGDLVTVLPRYGHCGYLA